VDASYVRPSIGPRPRGSKALLSHAGLLVCALLLSSPASGDWSGGGPEIGWVRTLLQTSGQVLYAGTYGGGIFRSTDGGLNWTEATTNARDAVVIDLAQGIDPGRTLYAATADRSLLRKEAGSDFWSELGSFPTGDRPPGVSIETFPFREFRIAFGSEQGVFMSNNLGASWPDTLQFAAGQSINDLLVFDAIPNTVHALTPLELVITSNNGQSEDAISDGLPPATFMLDLEPWFSGTDSLLVSDLRGPVWQFVDRDHFVEVGPLEGANPSSKYVCRLDTVGPGRILLGSSAGLWVSEDRLASWSRVDDQLPAQGAEVWAIEPSRVAPTDTLRMGSFTMGFLRTAAGGAAPWTVSNSGLTAAWARTIAPVAGSVLCGTAHGRLYRSSDQGASWQDVTGGLRTLQISVCHDTGSTWILSGSTGVVRSTDQGATWLPVALPPGVTRLNRLIESAGRLYAATNSGLVSSDDDGVSFVQVAGVPTGRASFALAMSDSGELAVGLDPGPQVFASSIYRGDADAGFAETVPPTGFRSRVRGLAFSGADLLVGGDGFGGSALYRITGSPTPEFVDLAALIGDGFFEVRDLAVRANLALVGTADDGAFISSDFGASWREYNEGLPTRRIEAVAFAPAPSRAIWVATLGRGAFSREADANVAIAVSQLAVEATDQGVRVRLAVAHSVHLRLRREGPGVSGRTLLEGVVDRDVDILDRLSASDGGLVEYIVEIAAGSGWVEQMRVQRRVDELVPPLRSRLMPAVPNPFNPRTTLRFTLARRGPVRLEIFDARGRRVRRLLDRELVAGPHSLGFDGHDDSGRLLASGVYYLLLSADDGQWRGRITLLR